MLADLSNLTADELAGAILLLGDAANQITMATEVVRGELVLRQLADADTLSDASRMQTLIASRPDKDKHAGFGDLGQEALQRAVDAAPQMATMIVERRDSIAAVLAQIPDDLKDEARPRLEAIPGVGPLPDETVANFMKPVNELLAARAAAAGAAAPAGT